ncbi:MAG: hypothetical protein HQK98_06520 [Nitrospirae bacterium]|nr:hypothetical protein [Nitrospirota bacterium]
MALHDFTTGQFSIPEDGQKKVFRLKNNIDFSQPWHNVLATDVVKVLAIPANVSVKNLFVRVNTVEGATATAVVNDYSTNPAYISSVNINSLGTTEDALTKGRIYTAPHTLHFVPANNLANANVDFIAFCEDLN